MPVRSPVSESASLSPQQAITQIAELRSVHSAFHYLHNQEMEFRRWQMELAEIAAPPFGESARAEWVRHRSLNLGLFRVHTDELGDVFGRLGEPEEGPLVGMSARVDRVCPQGTPLGAREEG